MTTTQNTTAAITTEDLVDRITDAIIRSVKPLAEAERGKNHTYHFEWEAEARKAAYRIGRCIEM